ncbi:ABC transporter [Microbacterium sp. HD4P20]|uniref:ABC transporter n=1 Tax=Microbacterium sp. HD4P20 TaxID=2864874 RepID=UPI001C6444D9|nr:ABC transporter [Microbacterium sp. HD4P20]MCP2636288.1 ABC transporter [Microbacterium sp. HD4P20]
MRRSAVSLPLAGLLLVTLAGCAGASAAAPATPTGEGGDGDGHGNIQGAAEVSEPPLGLTTIDPDGGVLHLDLLDESVADLGRVPSPSQVAGDGRYLFATGPDGVTVVDSGRWTWDHVDHFHYYRAEPRIVGEVPGAGPATVATTNSSTTGGTGIYFAESGDAVLLDTEALSKGEIVEKFRVETTPHDGLVVPVGSFALVTEPRGGVVSTVAVYDESAMPVRGATAECPDARGTITTRVGAVIGCGDGALLATVEDGEVAIEHIPYPAGTTAARATAFANREGRPTVAALAGDDGIWLLDTRARSWTLRPAPAPLVQVTAVDNKAEHVLALTTDGRVLVLDGTTGALLAETAPLVAESLSGGVGAPALIADEQRAYLNGPAEQRLYEIDFADAARVARVFDTDVAPTFLVETGR